MSQTEGCSICLFEGFVSYKHKGRSDHMADVAALQKVVRDPVRSDDPIYEGGRLKRAETDQLVSAFRVMGFDWGIPAVIKASV
jgi:hypothetical protein